MSVTSALHHTLHVADTSPHSSADASQTVTIDLYDGQTDECFASCDIRARDIAQYTSTFRCLSSAFPRLMPFLAGTMTCPLTRGQGYLALKLVDVSIPLSDKPAFAAPASAPIAAA